MSGGLGADRLVALIARNVDGPDATPREALLAHLAAVAPRPIPDRIAAWASVFLDRNEADYRLGDEPGGYVTERLLVNDRHTDCMLFTQRVVELAHADMPESALLEALERRFRETPLDEIVRADGGVDYTHPARLAFAWDLVEAGVLGRNVTETVGTIARDPGTARYGPDRVRYVPSGDLDLAALQDGDVVFLVLDEMHAGAARVRAELGAVIGHMGIVRRPDEARPELVHAASAALPGVYDGGRIVAVGLGTYLARVERFKGVVVTRAGTTGGQPAASRPPSSL